MSPLNPCAKGLDTQLGLGTSWEVLGSYRDAVSFRVLFLAARRWVGLLHPWLLPWCTVQSPRQQDSWWWMETWKIVSQDNLFLFFSLLLLGKLVTRSIKESWEFLPWKTYFSEKWTPPVIGDKGELVVVVVDANRWQQSLPWGRGERPKKHANVKDILQEGRHSKH